MVDLAALTALGVLSVLSGACASTGAVPRPFPVPGAAGGARTDTAPPTGSPSSTSLPGGTASRDYALVGTALSLRGVPYRNGGADPNGFDCSGFTQYVYAQYGVALPREVREQFGSGKRVDMDKVAPGDLLFFDTEPKGSPGPTHVGIAIGGDQFVHAPSSTGVVRVERTSASYWAARFLGARRIG